MPPTLLIVAGPNGSGKTTLVRSGVLSRLLDLPAVSINADDFAKELADGGQPTDDQSLQAARMADTVLDREIAAGRSVMVETVLSSDKHRDRVTTARSAGFHIVLVYVSVQIADLNIARVKTRVAMGGHQVPNERILARRARSHTMFHWFAEAADRVFVFDNSTTAPHIAAYKDKGRWVFRDISRLPPKLRDIVFSLFLTEGD